MRRGWVVLGRQKYSEQSCLYQTLAPLILGSLLESWEYICCQMPISFLQTVSSRRSKHLILRSTDLLSCSGTENWLTSEGISIVVSIHEKGENTDSCKCRGIFMLQLHTKFYSTLFSLCRFPMQIKLLRLNETYSILRIAKNLFDKCPIQNDLQQGDALSPCFSTLL